MKYDFDTVIDRRNSNSLKWNVSDKELPMWVADMDFKIAPEIQEALKKKVEHGIFGYSIISEEWYQAIIQWWNRNHDFLIDKEWLIFCSGVIPAISSIIRKLTTVGENILIQTPVYNNFFNSIFNNGRNVLENQLKYYSGTYEIDFEDLEKKLANPQTTMMILCNPHNPIGKIWDIKTLERIGELCWKYQVLVLADEIHCEFTSPGYHYIPFASVSEKCRQNSITCISPTKTFNLAGLQTAAVVIPNEVIRHKVDRAFNTDEIAEPNAFAVEAAVSAFTEGETWLNELRKYLYENKCFVNEFLQKEISKLKVVSLDATYLLWIDCSRLIGDTEEFCHFLREKTGLYLSNGSLYGKSGKDFLRMNIACPRTMIEDALERLKAGVLSYEKWAENQC